MIGEDQSDGPVLVPGVEAWSQSVAETRRLAECLASKLPPGSRLLLEGAMGAGKTVFVQGLASGLEIDSAQVQSPTFGLIHEYRGERRALLHVDLYRLEPEEVASLGLEELLEDADVAAIEWPDRLPFEVAGAERILFESVEESEVTHRKILRVAACSTS